ncbi:Fic/DOC family protein [Nocardioides sp.]|uniref:Fic/DOC family protein n=1 Tax=Nocardioides sp. TaxID=35761 RepID=UPI0035AE1457
MTTRPWEVGGHDERWDGYFAGPDLAVLANKVGATTPDELHAAENDLLEVRFVELRTGAVCLSRSYDTQHLKAIHFHLFQDVYEWAGEERTVGLRKGGGDSFMPPLEIERPLEHVWQRVAETDKLRSIEADELPHEVAYLYDYVNFAHPFREGNGRTQREFFDQLLSESGRGINWQLIEKDDLHTACHVARNDQDLEPMERLFATMLNGNPAYQL